MRLSLAAMEVAEMADSRPTGKLELMGINVML
jgi:hypothetical protein